MANLTKDLFVEIIERDFERKGVCFRNIVELIEEVLNGEKVDDYATLADFFNKIEYREEDGYHCYVVNVKHRGLPGEEDVEKAKQRLIDEGYEKRIVESVIKRVVDNTSFSEIVVDNTSFSEIVFEYIYNVVVPELEKELGRNLMILGRNGGYWGVESEEVIEPFELNRDGFKKIAIDYLREFVDESEELNNLIDIANSEKENLKETAINVFTEIIDNFADFIIERLKEEYGSFVGIYASKLLNKNFEQTEKNINEVVEKIWNTVYSVEEGWVDFIYDFIKQELNSKN